MKIDECHLFEHIMLIFFWWNSKAYLSFDSYRRNHNINVWDYTSDSCSSTSIIICYIFPSHEYIFSDCFHFVLMPFWLVRISMEIDFITHCHVIVYIDDDDISLVKIPIRHWFIKSTLWIFQRKDTDPAKEQLTLCYGMTKGNKRFGNLMHNHHND
jgi:hypothetical protein